MKRYILVVILAPILCLGYGINFYLKQNTIYQQNASFKNIADEQDSATSAIASLLGEKTGSLSPSEVIGMIQSTDFLQKAAILLHENEKVMDLNFAGIIAEKPLKAEHLFKRCDGKKECEIVALRNVIGKFFMITEDRVVEKKFWVNVKTLDMTTTQVLTEVVIETVMEARKETIRHHISQQLKISEELVYNKKEEMKRIDLDALIQEKKKLEAKAQELNAKLASYNNFYHDQKLKLSYAETRLKETKDTIKKKVSDSDKEKFKKKKNLEAKLDKIDADIEAIKLVSKNLSSRDSQILNQLEKDKKKTKREIASIGNLGRSVKNVMKFLDKKDSESDVTEFDYQVLKGQFVKVKKDYNKVLKEKNEVINKLSHYEKKIEELKPSFEYLKLLEQKIIQLKLVESTIVPDLVFDKERLPVSSFKRASKGKVVGFSFGISLFLLILSIFVRYLFDDRIYDETELSKSFEDLTIIGNTPDFD